MSEHEEVYLGGHRNKYNYSYALYHGPQDPRCVKSSFHPRSQLDTSYGRNMSQRCNPIVIDNDGAELEVALITFKE